jgi:hypothetical protein
MVPKAKNYSSGDVARSLGLVPGDVVISEYGESVFVLVAIHKGYVIGETADGEVVAFDDDLSIERAKGAKK